MSQINTFRGFWSTLIGAATPKHQEEWRERHSTPISAVSFPSESHSDTVIGRWRHVHRRTSSLDQTFLNRGLSPIVPKCASDLRGWRPLVRVLCCAGMMVRSCRASAESARVEGHAGRTSYTAIQCTITCGPMAASCIEKGTRTTIRFKGQFCSFVHPSCVAPKGHA